MKMMQRVNYYRVMYDNNAEGVLLQSDVSHDVSQQLNVTPQLEAPWNRKSMIL